MEDPQGNRSELPFDYIENNDFHGQFHIVARERPFVVLLIFLACASGGRRRWPEPPALLDAPGPGSCPEQAGGEVAPQLG